MKPSEEGHGNRGRICQASLKSMCENSETRERAERREGEMKEQKFY